MATVVKSFAIQGVDGYTVEKIRFQDTKKVISCRDLDESNSKMMVVK